MGKDICAVIYPMEAARVELEDPIPEPEQRQRTRRIWETRNIVGAAVALLFVIGAGLGAFYLSGAGSQPAGAGAGPEPIPVVAATAVPASYIISSTAKAAVVPTPTVPVVPTQAGWVRRVLVQPGAQVTAGAPVAVLEPANDSGSAAMKQYDAAVLNMRSALSDLADARNELSTAQSAISAGEAKLEQARQNLATAQQTVQRAQLELDAASQNLQSQNSLLQKAQTLFQQGAGSKEELDQAEKAKSGATDRLNKAKMALDNAQADMQDARDRLQAEQGSQAVRKDNLAAAKASVKSAQDRVQYARKQVIQVQSELQASQRGNQPIMVPAPTNGTVSQIMVQPGTLVTPSMEIVRIQPAGAAVVTFDVSDDEATKYQMGMPALVQVPKAKKPLQGRIAAVPPLPTGGPARNRVIVQVQDPNNTLKPGTPVLVQVPLKRVKGLAVPQEAIQSPDKSAYVWAIVNRKAVRRPVDVAGYEKNAAVVTNGLKSKELVVLRWSRSLKNGAPVEIRGTIEPGSPAAQGDVVGGRSNPAMNTFPLPIGAQPPSQAPIPAPVPAGPANAQQNPAPAPGR